MRWIALLALAGCATTTPNRTATMADLRTRNGACASDMAEEGMRFFTSVYACALIGAPGTLSDDGKTPYLVSKIGGDSFETADLGNWQVTVIGPDGREMLKEMLPHQVPSVGYCDSSGCRKNGIAVTRMPAEWKPGTYRLVYVLAFNTSRTATMTLSLR